MEKIPIIGPIYSFFGGEDIDIGVFIAIFGVILIIYGLSYFGVGESKVVTIMFALSPIWLPIMAFNVFFSKWMDTVGLSFYVYNGRTTLEIKLPPEVFKSPEAMETVIAQIHNVATPDNLMQTYIDGKRPLPYSLELVSTEGEVKFYVNLPTKKTTEAFKVSLYSQYPGVEIHEVALDYTAQIPSDLKGYNLMGFHMGKKKDSAYPIKSYYEFGLDKLPKEEEKLDPMTPMLEALGSFKKNEHLWIQILITPHREKSFKFGQLRSGPNWEPAARAQIDKIMNRDPATKRAAGMDDQEFGMTLLSPGERSTLEAMELNLEKYPYETGIRWVYIAPEDKYRFDAISMMIRTFSQWDVLGRNAIGVRWRTDFNYKALSDPLGSRLKVWKKEELQRYKLRKYLPRSGADQEKIFTSLELATMYHLPGKVAITPGIDRITSTRSEAPSNLPIGNYEQ